MSSLQSIAWLGLIIAGAIALVTTSSASESHQAEVRLPVPICPPKDSEPRYHAGTRIPIVEQDATNLLLVSTLDGRLTALNTEGSELWSVDTHPGPMLSSTLSKLDQKSSPVRLIPSLAGGLYKFDGEVVEPVPLDAEALLKTSFQFSKDSALKTTMSGGKEKRTYGLDLATGRVRYECTIDGCKTGNDGSGDVGGDVLVVHRETQTVRALEPLTGQEKWNFSVSQHNLELHEGIHALCQDEAPTNDDQTSPDFEDDSDEDGRRTEDKDYDFFDEVTDGSATESREIKAVVSDGIICSVARDSPEDIIWKRKFGSPIVHAWKVKNGKMFKVNLFSSSHIPPRDDEDRDRSPVLFIGSYQNQLYVQENEKSLKNDHVYLDAGKGHELSTDVAFPKVTWKPYLISADSRTPIINHGASSEWSPLSNNLPLLTYDQRKAEKTALAVFQHPNLGYPYDAGWYFYKDEPILDNATISQEGQTEAGDMEGQANDGEITQIVVASLWYWWKEVIFISFVTAVMMNILITRPVIENIRANFKQRLTLIAEKKPEVVVVEIPVPKSPSITAGTGTETTSAPTSAGTATTAGSENPALTFVSRYVQDYETVSCLGAGGFGVVFESKNKLDEVNYAVKRVRLPAKDEAKKKVLREVKCLAKLDHRNIVRYFTTWLEYPPAGWQEARDTWWRNSERGGGGESQAIPSTTDAFSSNPREDETHPDQKPSTTFTQNNNPFRFDIATDLGDIDRRRISRPGGTSKDDSLCIRFEDSGSVDDSASYQPIDSVRSEEEVEESTGGIVFRDQTASNQAPSRCTAEMTKSKFWADGSETSSTNSASVCDALTWDENHRKSVAHKSSEVQVKGQKGRDGVEGGGKVYLYIVMQLCQRESLKSWLRSTSASQQRTRNVSLKIFKEICSGVEYVHYQGLIHRDLKPGNIFFSSNGTIKIGDFGLVTAHGLEEDIEDGSTEERRAPFHSNSTDEKGDAIALQHTAEVGTESYMSPEQIERKTYDHKVDIYSMGLILFELLVPFSTQMERIQTMSEARKLKFPEPFVSEMSDEHGLVCTMLSPSSASRPEASEILEMEFLTEVTPRGGDTPPRAEARRNRLKTLSTGASSSDASTGPKLFVDPTNDYMENN